MSAPGSSSSPVISTTPITTDTTITSGTSTIVSPTTLISTTPSLISTTPSTTSSIPPTTTPSSSSSISTTSSRISTTSSQPLTTTSVIVETPSGGTQASTVFTTITTQSSESSTSSSGAAAATSSSASNVGSASDTTSSSSKASVVAPAVIVPIVVIAALLVLGVFFWRRRKQRREAAELRAKEMEEYSYNPNNDPTIPPIGGAISTNGDDAQTEGGGYRGWGTTSTTARTKAGTTLGASSAAGIGIARSDSGGGYEGHYSPHGVSPEREAPGSQSPEGLGALGAAPLSSNNRGQGVNRGISNASSAYSGGQRSDGSDNIHAGYAGSPQYYDEFMHGDEAQQDGYGSPVIKDVSARRNTQIENPGVYPQHGNAGIAQNF